MMKNRAQKHSFARQFVFWGLVSFLPGTVFAQVTKVSALEIRDRSVVIIGDLGVPLGTPVEIEATIVHAVDEISDTKTKYCIAVNAISGKRLSTPRVFNFRAERELWSLMAATESELKALLDGYVRGDSGEKLKMTYDQANKYLLNYTKTLRKLTVYESGRFIGRARQLPPPSSKAPEFKFETYLVIVEPAMPYVQELLGLSVNTKK